MPRALAKGWLGCDVGVRAAVTCSDGYQGPDLLPVLEENKHKHAAQQKQGIHKRVDKTHQKEVLAREARRVVTLAKQTGRGVSFEDPSTLIRWKGHAARYFASRVVVLCQILGVPVCPVPPAGTSQESSCCPGAKGFRDGRMFRCEACGTRRNADFNASINIAHRASRLTATSQEHLELPPRTLQGVEA